MCFHLYSRCDDRRRRAGPDIVGFTLFASDFAQDFISLTDKSVLARGVVDLRARAVGWPADWISSLFALGQGCIEMADGDTIVTVAAYEIYSDTTLQPSTTEPDGYTWIPNTQNTSEVERLREQIRRLELSLRPANEADFLGTLTPSTVARFRTLPGLGQWVTDSLTVYEHALLTGPPDKHPYLLQLWDIMVRAHFRHTLDGDNGATSSSQASSKQRNPAQKARPAPFTVAQLRERGGTLDTEVSAKGALTFGILNNKKYYLSKRGVFWDTSVPPPAPCHDCNEFHWFWECEHTPSSTF